MKLLLLILFILAALLVLAIKFLPWWASLLFLGVGILGVRWGAKYLLRRIFILPFKMKGQALAGATAKVHGIEPAPLPEMAADFSEEEAGEYRQLNWYSLDITVIPPEQKSGFVAWEPSELLLVPPGLKEETLMGGHCIVHDLQVWMDHEFSDDSQGKYVGFQRLKLYIGVQPGIRQLSFRYYFEVFGQVEIPPHQLQPAQGRASA
jgi:hypothetical protein